MIHLDLGCTGWDVELVGVRLTTMTKRIKPVCWRVRILRGVMFLDICLTGNFLYHIRRSCFRTWGF